jgi:chemotaxis signal transduction protein
MRQVLVFRIGERPCGLDISHIKEVVADPLCHYIPRAPKWCAGAINVQGQVLPVVDLPDFLGCGAGPRDHRCIVLDVTPANLALRVSSIHRILAVDDDAVLLPKEAGSGPLVTAILQLADWRLELLDAKAVLQEVQLLIGECF